jgi:hypothetical protein
MALKHSSWDLLTTNYLDQKICGIDVPKFKSLSGLSQICPAVRISVDVLHLFIAFVCIAL